MRVVLIHFHLNTGGVTTVVRQQADVLKKMGHDLLLLTGIRPKERWPAPVKTVPGLAYDEVSSGISIDAGETSEAILRAIDGAWPGKSPDLIHIHNPTLAKNRHLQAVLKTLQRAGLTLLCQVHDFAEDGRPEVFFEEPYVADCHYAVVNGRDREILLRSGLLEQGVHHLPNAVPPLKVCEDDTVSDSGHVLYPVRAIRRKNIGEAILLKLCAFQAHPLAITLPPTSAPDLPGYEMWRRYVADHKLAVSFEAGLHSDFQRMVAGSRYLISTSINEGFGFSFLEAWTAGKALWGRMLPDICDDFTRTGIELGHLYTHLWVPLTWFDADECKKKWQTARALAARRYGMAIADDRTDTEWREITCSDRIDFGLLSERFQRKVIDRVLTAGERASRHLHEINPGLARFGSRPEVRELIEKNRSAVLAHYSLSNYSKRLIDIYQKVLTAPVRQQIDKVALFSAFMAPSRFSLLKWSAFDG